MISISASFETWNSKSSEAPQNELDFAIGQSKYCDPDGNLVSSLDQIELALPPQFSDWSAASQQYPSPLVRVISLQYLLTALDIQETHSVTDAILIEASSFSVKPLILY